MSKIRDYVVENWKNLPKSNFNEDKVVIVKEVYYDNGSYGHHNYDGYGFGKDGTLYFCQSSGCSCNGHAGIDKCEVDHTEIIKDEFEPILNLLPEDIDFDSLEVSFSDY